MARGTERQRNRPRGARRRRCCGIQAAVRKVRGAVPCPDSTTLSGTLAQESAYFSAGYGESKRLDTAQRQPKLKASEPTEIAMRYDEADKDFVKDTINLLYEMRNININQRPVYDGSDAINPRVTITKEEYKTETHRETLRDVSFSNLEKMFNDSSVVSAKREGDKLTVQTINLNPPASDFGSRQKLKEKIASKLAQDPELGEDCGI